MIEEGSERAGFPYRDAVITLAISLVMMLSSFLTLFIALPLLGFSTRHTKKDSLIVFGLECVFITAYSLWQMYGSSYYPFMVLLDLFFPLSLSAAGIIWTCTKGRRVDGRLLLSFLPSLLMVLAVSIILCADRALFRDIYSAYEDAFVPYLESIFESVGLSVDVKSVFLVMISLASVVMFPLVVGATCVVLFISERVSHSREGDWDEKLSALEFSPALIWPLIILLAVSLVSRFVSVPTVVYLLSMSGTTAFLILYGVQGFTVLLVWIRRGFPEFGSMKLFVILALTGLLIPGLNIIVLTGVPFIGILENFFDLKKRKEK